MLIPLIILLVILGFAAWVITRPGVPIEDPFKSIVMGILVLIAVVATFEAIGILHTHLLDGFKGLVG